VPHLNSAEHKLKANEKHGICHAQFLLCADSAAMHVASAHYEAREQKNPAERGSQITASQQTSCSESRMPLTSNPTQQAEIHKFDVATPGVIGEHCLRSSAANHYNGPSRINLKGNEHDLRSRPANILFRDNIMLIAGTELGTCRKYRTRASTLQFH